MEAKPVPILLSLLLGQVLQLTLCHNVFIDNKDASQIIRAKRANGRFEELKPGNLERECVEEICDQEEAREVFERVDKTEIFWVKYLACEGPKLCRTEGKISSLRVCLNTEVPEPDEPKLMDDNAVNVGNADPCTLHGCLWHKHSDGNIYVPYVIANHYSSGELEIIQRGLDSFASVSCIHFSRRSYESDYISIESLNGCYSYIGRQGKCQTVSLARIGCLIHSTVQHELIHALGFNHEQSRSDRDDHIRIEKENIDNDMMYNFDKIETLNLGTPYDYKSVMQYDKYAFSKNGKPTMIPIPNPNVELDNAIQMSQNDIIRINMLYNCSSNRGWQGDVPDIPLPRPQGDVRYRGRTSENGGYQLTTLQLT